MKHNLLLKLICALFTLNCASFGSTNVMQFTSFKYSSIIQSVSCVYYLFDKMTCSVVKNQPDAVIRLRSPFLRKYPQVENINKSKIYFTASDSKGDIAMLLRDATALEIKLDSVLYRRKILPQLSLSFNLTAITIVPLRIRFDCRVSHLIVDFDHFDHMDLVHFRFNWQQLMTYRLYIIEVDSKSKQMVHLNYHNLTSSYLPKYLKPNRRYQLRLEGKLNDTSNVYWSTSPTIEAITPNDLTTPPQTVNEAFTELNNGYLYLYLKKSRQRDDFYSSVEYGESFARHRQFSGSSVKLKVSDIPRSRRQFRLRHQNAVSFTEAFTEMTPPHVLLPPLQNIIVYFQNLSSVKITWDAATNNNNMSATSYTVFWCTGSGNDCFDNFEWHTTTETEFILEDTKTSINLFGVAQSTAHSTSGIAWTDCIVKLPLESLQGLHIEANETNALTIEWDYVCAAQRQAMRHIPFSITLCPVTSQNVECREKPRVVETLHSAARLDNLHSNRQYYIEISSRSLVKPIQKWARTTGYNEPASSPNDDNITNPGLNKTQPIIEIVTISNNHITTPEPIKNAVISKSYIALVITAAMLLILLSSTSTVLYYFRKLYIQNSRFCINVTCNVGAMEDSSSGYVLNSHHYYEIEDNEIAVPTALPTVETVANSMRQIESHLEQIMQNINEELADDSLDVDDDGENDQAANNSFAYTRLTTTTTSGYTKLNARS